MATKAIDINVEMTVDEVIRKHPATQKVLVRHGIDTCCGGYRKIKDGAKVSGANLDNLLAELNAAAN